MKNKYSLISEQEIKDGLANGLFKKDTIGLIRNKDGHIVKHLKESFSSNSLIPSTIVQVHQSIIYQADLSPIIDAMIEINNTLLFDGLEDHYKIVLDKLRSYRNHRDRLDDLNLKALESLSIFDNKVTKLLSGVNAGSLSEDDRVFSVLDSYLNLIFIYMVSTHWMHHNRLPNDTNAIIKLDALESKIKSIYEVTLASNINSTYGLVNSVYAYLLLDNRGRETKDISELVRYDSRYDNEIDFIGSFVNKCVCSDDYNNYYKIDYPDNLRELKKRYTLAKRLNKYLEMIGYLRNIYGELIEAGSVNLDEVHFKDGENNELHPLVAICLKCK